MSYASAGQVEVVSRISGANGGHWDSVTCHLPGLCAAALVARLLGNGN